jgi:starch synthase
MPNQMTVLFATADFAPRARVGGLAAAVAGLVAELRRQGVSVEVVMPDYGSVELAGETAIDLVVPAWAAPARARSGTVAGIGEITLISTAGLARSHPYLQPDGNGWFDNDLRFMGFSAAIAALAEVRGPDVLHLNDWHTAAAVGHLAAPPPTVLTIHTLGYQGNTNRGWLQSLAHHREAFDWYGDCNPLAGGIRLADLVVAVSPNYAREITTPEGGFGLDPLLRERGARLVGILNGIDDREWNPSTDRHLPATFDWGQMAGKAANRAALIDRCGLADSGGPVIAAVTRLVHQKGIDLLTPSVPFLGGLNASLVVLGDGEQWLADSLQHAADDRPDQVAFVRGYDESLAHLIFAGADVFAMPSRFEPCGLAQMQAMRYGALPMVTGVGGLVDTVVDIDADKTHGTGVVTPAPTPEAVTDGLHRAVRAWGRARRRAAMQRRGMTADWSWSAPASAQIAWYERLVGGV